jgi:hypothetical protein
MKSDVRWVGFDMDECVGSVMPLFDFIHEVRDDVFEPMLDLIYESEITGRTWLFRPAIFKTLRTLWLAKTAKKIQGAFLFSNNGSARLVRYVAAQLNYFIQRMMNVPVADLFQMAIHLSAPCRREFGSEKSYEAVQHCLATHDLPPCSSPEHLLFFDDMSHVLQSQILHYVQVSAYLNHTDVSILADVLRPLSYDDWDALVESAVLSQRQEIKDNGYIMEPQEMSVMAEEEQLFHKAIRTFLGSAKNSRINRRNGKLSFGAQKTRKVRRRL